MLYDELKAAIRPLKTAGLPNEKKELLSVRYRYDGQFPGQVQPERYLRLIAGGRVDAAEAFAVSIQPVDCLLILCSLQGIGQFSSEHSALALERGSIFLFPCAGPCRLSSALPPWSFRLFFAVGPDLDRYLSLLGDFCLTSGQRNPFMASAAEELAAFPEQISPSSLIRGHRLLTDLLSDACLAALPAQTAVQSGIPSYLQELYTYIHDCKNPDFSLAKFEALYGVSRYRLCREYSRVYQISPLKDFNRVRMMEAKKLLLNTHLQVQEISSRLGYENTNHFIRLFKSETGFTPGAFRESGE